MLKFARLSRPLAALPLLAALASTAPLVRWCPMPWSEVTVEDFVACEGGAGAGARPCADDGAARPSVNDGAALACANECAPPRAGNGAPLPRAEGCPSEPESESGRAYCLEAPVAATPGPGSIVIDPPAAQPALLAAGVLPAPACVTSRPAAFEPIRPHSRQSNLPPPVRGPPLLA